MPELPEVETIRRDLAAHILHKKIIHVEVTRSKVVRGGVEPLLRVLVGHMFSAVERRAKLLLFCVTDSPVTVLVHLKMTGQLIYTSRSLVIAGGHSQSDFIAALPNQHTRVTITFADQSKLFFNDMRLFGYMQLATLVEKERVLSGYGIEPLTAGFTLPAFRKCFVRRKTTLKAVLLNQAIIAGIGNIYADEICFDARIRPSRPVHHLTDGEIKRLFVSTTRILKLAIEKRGTTFNTFIDGAGNKGNFLAFLKVYGRDGEMCRRCRKTILLKKKVASRGTVYCPTCQT